MNPALLKDELHRIFSECKPYIRAFVIKNRGDQADADDILQDTFIIINTKIEQGGFKEIRSAHAFLIGIGRKLWLEELRNRKMKIYCDTDLTFTYQLDDSDSHIWQQQCYNLYWQHFKNLNTVCRKIIMSALKKTNSTDVRQLLGLTVDYYYKRRSICMKTLLLQIKNDPKYKRLISN